MFRVPTLALLGGLIVLSGGLVGQEREIVEYERLTHGCSLVSMRESRPNETDECAATKFVVLRDVD